MKKYLFSILIALALIVATAVPVFAADPPGVVNVSAGGTNGTVDITTVAPYVTDVLALTTTGTFSIQQTNRFVESAAWAGDGNDIDRTAQFVGVGTLTSTTHYQSNDAWALAAADLDSSVTASASGYLHQNLSFDQNNGGVYTLDQWKKQRDMIIQASGSYTLDVSDVGASIAPSLGSMPTGSLPAYSMDVNSTATSGLTQINFTPNMAAGQEGLSNNGDHGTYTGMNTNFLLQYTGSPVVNITTQSVTSENMVIVENFVAHTVSGTGTIK